jgi:hypothetical protein
MRFEKPAQTLQHAETVAIAPELPNTVLPRVETPNKSLDLYSLTVTGLDARELH